MNERLFVFLSLGFSLFEVMSLRSVITLLPSVSQLAIIYYTPDINKKMVLSGFLHFVLWVLACYLGGPTVTSISNSPNGAFAPIAISSTDRAWSAYHPSSRAFSSAHPRIYDINISHLIIIGYIA
ncbi:hypothetical protein BDN70DRAFT_377752 [Pholiota conissans]|uniref:Uncharacterized protein n=1 Tax=Pholiota conissans TaxID=109636 RepID=A0A9P5YPH8_9AGAR|nr:hypothetical protein BDN70DRAFT_377752 [Pholiota conissans]